MSVVGGAGREKARGSEEDVNSNLGADVQMDKRYLRMGGRSTHLSSFLPRFPTAPLSVV